MTDILVEVRGGVVTGIYARGAAQSVTVVDWDHFDSRTPTDCVAVYPTAPMESVATETMDLVRVAEESAGTENE